MTQTVLTFPPQAVFSYVKLLLAGKSLGVFLLFILWVWRVDLDGMAATSHRLVSRVSGTPKSRFILRTLRTARGGARVLAAWYRAREQTELLLQIYTCYLLVARSCWATVGYGYVDFRGVFEFRRYYNYILYININIFFNMNPVCSACTPRYICIHLSLIPSNLSTKRACGPKGVNINMNIYGSTQVFFHCRVIGAFAVTTHLGFGDGLMWEQRQQQS